ncbi:hypothetical protein L1987_01127 [Smallanthus sonchifolius]|uniref:Uncharacterized protein n=1 Tax=Smallanthus sonchifolius TaxID=185202 RepID=A0ACB9K4E2_9ASTR|nr:hypothetical protein L1987_01127 [Smallanthus sonchifolius]
MVQRKVPTKLGIKPHLLKLDTQLVNLKPSSPSSSSSTQTHEKLKKIMKKSRSIKRADESTRNKKTPDSTPQKQSPNYMKSTSSFEARKEQSPKTPTPKGSRNSKTNESSLKMVRTLTKTPSFKPLRPSKKVILCKDVDAQRATCSSTLKESKFPDYLQLDPGGTELDGTSTIKVCPYTYCSLNGHHHDPVPPLKCFLSSKRRALKTQKGFKLGCLSPRQIKPNMRKVDVTEPMVLEPEEENRDFFIDIYSKDIDWEEGICSDSGDGLQEITEDETGKTGLDNEHQELYDEESVGAWSDEDGDSASESSSQQMKVNQDYLNCDEFDVSSTAESDVSDKIDDILIEDQNMNYQKEETCDELKTVPDFVEKLKDGDDKNHTTIIYNIIQFNISVFINGEKIEHSVQVPATSVAVDKMETEEAMEEPGRSNEDDEVNQIVTEEEEVPSNVQDLASTEHFEKQDDPEQECNEYEASNSLDEEPEIKSDVDQTHETDINTNPFGETSASSDELQESGIDLRDLTGRKKPSEEAVDELLEFNPRGPNFLPETPDPDAETVDLRHQTMDERKNAEEWMLLKR